MVIGAECTETLDRRTDQLCSIGVHEIQVDANVARIPFDVGTELRGTLGLGNCATLSLNRTVGPADDVVRHVLGERLGLEGQQLEGLVGQGTPGLMR